MNLYIAPTIDQSMSCNRYITQPTIKKLTSMYFYAWEKGMKTLIYYLRTSAGANPVKFTNNKIKWLSLTNLALST